MTYNSSDHNLVDSTKQEFNCNLLCTRAKWSINFLNHTRNYLSQVKKLLQKFKTLKCLIYS